MHICVFSKITNLIQVLRIVLPNHKFIEITQASDESFKNCDILIGDFTLLGPHLYNLPNVKWIQGTWAGVETLIPYINRPLPYQMSRFSGNHFGRIITEYVVASIVNHERDFLNVRNNQQKRLWTKEGKISHYRGISELTVGILGVGNIGSWIGRSLNTFGAKVLGYGRKPSRDYSEEHNYLTSYFTKDNLPELLKKSDYIVNTLPHTPETVGLLNRNILENCKDKETVFINVGRGSIIDDIELLHALNQSWISGAILDVFNTEPLPASNPLWTTPNVFITPHVSGVSKPIHIAQQFQENLKLFLSNKPIPNQVLYGNQY